MSPLWYLLICHHPDRPCVMVCAGLFPVIVAEVIFLLLVSFSLISLSLVISWTLIYLFSVFVHTPKTILKWFIEISMGQKDKNKINFANHVIEKQKNNRMIKTMQLFSVLRPETYFFYGLLWGNSIFRKKRFRKLPVVDGIAPHRLWKRQIYSDASDKHLGAKVFETVLPWRPLVVCTKVLCKQVFLLKMSIVPAVWNLDKRPCLSRNISCKWLFSIWLLRIILNSSWISLILKLWLFFVDN